MVWVLERNNDILTCAIRQVPNSTDYEFHVAKQRGPIEISRFGTATELINGYLRRQIVLESQGWRPRATVNEL